MITGCSREQERSPARVEARRSGSRRRPGSGIPVSPLWGPDFIGRFRLGESSRLDEAKLLPVDQPDRDVFLRHANRFRVVIPAALVPDATAEAVLRHVIEAEKPAHTTYELELIGPRFRLGVQSTVGIDTILGGAGHMAAAGGRRSSCGPRSTPPRTAWV